MFQALIGILATLLQHAELSRAKQSGRHVALADYLDKVSDCAGRIAIALSGRAPVREEVARYLSELEVYASAAPPWLIENRNDDLEHYLSSFRSEVRRLTDSPIHFMAAPIQHTIYNHVARGKCIDQVQEIAGKLKGLATIIRARGV